MKHKLDNIDKKEVFEVPEGYFEDLPLKIQARIDAEKPKSVVRSVPSWSLAMAASALFVLAFVFIFSDKESTVDDLLAEVSNEELVAYLDQIDLDEYDIASAFEDDVDALNLEETNVLDGIDMEDQVLDDVLLEYDLGDEYL